jgi:hypothetical protein
MADYVCPNGHVFPGALTVPCDECGAAVVCEPIAAGMRLHRLLEAAEADLREATAHEAACGRELADARAILAEARDYVSATAPSAPTRDLLLRIDATLRARGQ